MLGQYHRGQHCSVASKKANFARVEKAGVTRVTGVAEVHGDGGQETPIIAVKFFVAYNGDDFTIHGPKSLDPILQLLNACNS